MQPSQGNWDFLASVEIEPANVNFFAQTVSCGAGGMSGKAFAWLFEPGGPGCEGMLKIRVGAPKTVTERDSGHPAKGFHARDV